MQSEKSPSLKRMTTKHLLLSTRFFLVLFSLHFFNLLLRFFSVSTFSPKNIKKAILCLCLCLSLSPSLSIYLFYVSSNSSSPSPATNICLSRIGNLPTPATNICLSRIGNLLSFFFSAPKTKAHSRFGA